MSVATDRHERTRLLFERHADELYRYIRCLAPTDIDPKDVVQETFIRAYKSLDQLRSDGLARAWLYRIARNYLYDLMRKRQIEIHNMQFLPRGGPSGLESSLEVLDALKSLPLNYQQVLYLHSLKGFSVQEVAESLGKSAVAIRVSLHRAKKALAAKLDFVEANDSFTSTRKGVHKDEAERG
ncbi:RNA polymerase sigma factor [Alicyclobacillus ferrooxydans]|uniref:RNA polymerase subunit sigma-70 n=1 Tax=Alicyclobacillus ferrooxydans TaxID=471514 RepID=A0A0P9CC65_9BACL|nr:sigma-70 family RNA polymerase sigma factor [Alicyclobacillus ferrooxydans]KPV43164.1 hypothetical protein AN477_13820 [Alicyclobacillus ferrooxydans]